MANTYNTMQDNNWSDNWSDSDGHSLNTLDEIKMIEKAKRADVGYNKFFRTFKYENEKGQIRTKRVKHEFYTSRFGVGALIRDAESGEYYEYKVGSADEDLFFKAIIHSGLCNNKGKTTTAFFSSPNAYMQLMDCELSENIVSAWEKKRNARLEVLKTESNKTINMASVVVR